MGEYLRKDIAALVVSGGHMNEAGRRDILVASLKEQGWPAFVAAEDDVQALLEDTTNNIGAVFYTLQDAVAEECAILVRHTAFREKGGGCYSLLLLCGENERELFSTAARSGADDFLYWPLNGDELRLRLDAARLRKQTSEHGLLLDILATLCVDRGGETGEHLRRVREFSRLLAEDLRVQQPALNISTLAVEDIAILSVLHDIGCKDVPDSLLKKRGRLTPREWELIRDHTVAGGKLLRQMAGQLGAQFLQLGAEIALCHHERWDGKGYPCGLKGEAIPVAARIVAFADVFDIMLSRRPYKDALTLDHVERCVEAERGKHFDPIVVDSYIRQRDNFLSVLERYPDAVVTW